ncbi:hypothetical protein OS493_022243 [Desmophyllum pertusum]|uniref:Uncharacterized protein n=1 Tax=Desmophyllum pertusum TaxID=174260 RepID=A0A9W9YCJ3_9CNID|nr:hypothetical protein OS493_022243 [Desmophyllum pertusum]
MRIRSGLENQDSYLLRLLTVSELFAYVNFYAQHPQFEEVSTAADYTTSAIICLFLSENKALDTYKGNFSSATQAIQVLAQQTAKSYVYSPQFHILALASVINKPIFVAYPDIPSVWRIKLACHGCFYPREALLNNASREGLKSETIFVMWTRAERSPLEDWEPNHFVLLTKRSANSFKKELCCSGC